MKDCDVFVHARRLDGNHDLVGRYRTLRPDGSKPLGEFTYVPSWLRNEHGHAFSLDPTNLPLVATPHFTRKRTCLHGTLADATPDRWGRRVVEASIGPHERPLSSSDWLLITGDDRVGCLAFSRTPAVQIFQTPIAGVLDLAEIARGFEQIAAGKPTDVAIERLFRAGRSLGGARPKATVAHDGSLWIAKFQKRDDEYDQCSVEHATMRLAALCGIEVPQTRVETVGPRRVLLVKRFDRSDGPDFQVNAHYLSALSALDIDETEERGSYADIAGFLRRFSSEQAIDRAHLFRRMAFNVLSGNRDDHLKNHAFLWRDGHWRLSPAFDLVPQPAVEPLQSIGIGRLGVVATVANCLSSPEAFGLETEAAKHIVESLVETMRHWPRLFRDWAVDDHAIRMIEPAFNLLPRGPNEDVTSAVPNPDLGRGSSDN